MRVFFLAACVTTARTGYNCGSNSWGQDVEVLSIVVDDDDAEGNSHEDRRPWSRREF